MSVTCPLTWSVTVVLVKDRVVRAAVQSQQLIAAPPQLSYFAVKCVLCWSGVVCSRVICIVGSVRLK